MASNKNFVELTFGGDADALEKASGRSQDALKRLERASELAGKSLEEFKADAHAAGTSADTLAKATLDLESRADKLGKSFDQLQAEAKAAGVSMHEMADRAEASNAAFDQSAEKFDSAEQRATGFRDSITGVQDSMAGMSALMKGDVSTGLFTTAAGFGDLASAGANLVVPAIQKTTAALNAMDKTMKRTVIGLALAAAAAAAAFFIFRDEAEETSEEVKDLSKDLEVLATTSGKYVTGELRRTLMGFKDISQATDILSQKYEGNTSILGANSASHLAHVVAVTAAEDKLQELDDLLVEMVESGLTYTQAIDAATSVMGEEAVQAALLSGRLDDFQKATRDAAERQNALAQKTEIVEKNFKEALASAEDFYDFLKAQTDPLFAYTAAKQAYAEAQDAITEAEKEFGKNSPQYQEAVLNSARANLELDAATNAAAGSLTEEMIASMDLTAQEANALREQVGLLEDDFGKLDGKQSNMKIRLTIEQNQIRAEQGTTRAGGSITVNAPIYFHDGGIVPGRRGEEVAAILQAGERVISLDDMDRGGAGNTYHITVNGLAELQEFLNFTGSLRNNRRRGLVTA